MQGKYEIERQYMELFFGLVFDSQLFIECWDVLWSHGVSYLLNE